MRLIWFTILKEWVTLFVKLNVAYLTMLPDGYLEIPGVRVLIKVFNLISLISFDHFFILCVFN